MNRRPFCTYAVLAVSVWQSGVAVAADPLVDHPPYRASGAAADTSFLSPANGQPSTQFLADRFSIADGTPIRRIVWWGFDWNDNPPVTESFRIRFYNGSIATGLPGSVVAETISNSASREPTGRQIAAGVQPDELRYQLDLPQAVWLTPAESYWLEIAQVGDLSHTFGWVYSIPPGYDGVAYRFSEQNAWSEAPTAGDMAFQLWSVPEPATLCLLACGALFARRRLLARDYAGRAP